MSSTKEKKLPKLFWIDRTVDEGQNKYYLKTLETLPYELKPLKSVTEGIKSIKTVSFEKIIVIIRGTMFEDFLKIFKKEFKNISCTIDIIIFTSKVHKNLVEDICTNDRYISSGCLFNNKKIFIYFKQLCDYLKGNSPFDLMEKKQSKEIFEKIENYKQLILPIYYQEMMQPITIEEIHNFNEYLMNFFGKEMKDLISQLENIPDMPNEIVCKYWIRAYTLQTSFYDTIKSKLQQKQGKFFVPYIKMSYEGVKNKTFKSIFDKELYRGAVISNSELEKLKAYLNSNQNKIEDKNLPKIIHYFKPYQSFSMKKEEAIKFMEKAKQKDDNTRILFIIKKRENSLEEELFSNAYIRDYSRYKSEDEVLFFPYSCFGIEKIEPVENHVEIYLEYLGKYRTYIESIKRKKDLFDDIPMTNFAKDIVDLGLIKYNFKKYWSVVKSIKINEGNCSSIICLNKSYLLFSIQGKLRIYNLLKDEVVQEIIIHSKNINNLLKVEENIIITSSEDKTIKFIELINNFSKFNLIKTIEVHKNSVNQVIKLKSEQNTYASCSKDKTIKIFQLNKNNYSLIRNLEGHESDIISIFELPNNEIISSSALGFLKFWENNICTKTLGIHEKMLFNNIHLFNNSIISIGTKNSIIFVDFIKKEIVKKYLLDLPASSICNFFGNLIFGTRKNDNLCYLREYQILDDEDQIDIECVGKGKDKVLEISYIHPIDKETLATSNINNYIKIWEKTDKKPENFFLHKANENIILNEYEENRQIFMLKNEIKNKDEINNNLKNEIAILSKKTYLLEEKLNEKYKGNSNNMNYSQKDEEEIIIIFMHISQTISPVTVKCFQNELFGKVVERVLKMSPKLAKSQCIFLSNGNIIKENSRIKDNGIKNNDIIMISEVE